MQRQGIYSISYRKGVYTLTKESDKYLKRRNRNCLDGDFIMNPYTEIENGVLHVTGRRHSFTKIVIVRDDGWNGEWNPTPLRDLEEGWGDSFYFSRIDITVETITTKTGIWPFRKKVVEEGVSHLKAGYYVSKESVREEITTSNFRINE